MVCVLLFAAPGLAGCLSDDTGDDDPETTTTRVKPTVSADLGAIEGVVTDPAVQPIAEATVTVVETGQNTTTRSDGSFVLNELDPGSYTLAARHDAFVSSQQSVQIAAGEVSVADFLLVNLVSDLPYTQTLELAGFMSCGTAVGWNATNAPAPPSPVPDPRTFGVSWTMCEDVDHALGNSTQDETFWMWEMDAPLHTLIYEIEWDARGNQLATHFTSRVNIADWAREFSAGPYTVLDVNGESPLHARVDRADLVALQENFSALCEEGEDAYCGYGFFDQGWAFGGAVLPSWPCVHDRAGGCLAAQQPFTLYISGFYNAPGPDGFSIVERKQG